MRNLLATCRSSSLTSSTALPQSGFRTCAALFLRPFPDSTSNGPCPQSPVPHGPRFPSIAPFPADEIPRMPGTRRPVRWENSAPAAPRPDRASACNAGNRRAQAREIAVNGRFPANFAESEFGAPSQCQGALFTLARTRFCHFFVTSTARLQTYLATG